MRASMWVRSACLTAVLCLWLGACCRPPPAAPTRLPLAPSPAPVQAIANGQAFKPVSDATIRGGAYTVPALSIPQGVTVRATGDLVINVTGEMVVAGVLQGSCVRMDLQGQGDVKIAGTLDNRCADDAKATKDLTIAAHGGALNVGAADAPATILTSGNLNITNAPTRQASEFDLLPGQRSAAPMAPVCAAHSDKIADTTRPDSPVTFAFNGQGVDPDGGPVSFRWDFGDGVSSAERHPTHTYTSWGAYDVTLTVTDDEGQSCAAMLRLIVDDGDAHIPSVPAVALWPTAVIAETGEEIFFTSHVFAAFGQPIAYAWDFGDAGRSTEADPAHRYDKPGRYGVTLTVRGQDGGQSFATAYVYVYPAPTANPFRAPGLARSAAILAAMSPTVINARLTARNIALSFRGDVILAVPPGPALHHQTWPGARGGLGRGRDGGVSGDYRVYASGSLTINAGLAIKVGQGGDGDAPPGFAYLGGNGGRGGSVILKAEQDIVVGGGAAATLIQAGDGGGGAAAIGEDNVRGGNGGAGGSVYIEAGRQLTIGPNVTIRQGSGGAAGSATATGKKPRSYGGAGGNAGTMVALKAGKLTQFIGPNTIELGNGGRGGNATATGANGAGCGQADGAHAFGRAGAGGLASKLGQMRKAAFVGLPLTVTSAQGGGGGSATAQGGAGANAACGQANGGRGGAAEAYGGRGGHAVLSGEALSVAVLIAPAAFKGGNGGAATATGAKGGNALCGGAGGDGGAATAEGGTGGKGRGPGNHGAGGAKIARGGNGGTGGACAQGGDGGKGGNARAEGGVAGGPGAADGAAGGAGGNGGAGGTGNPPGKGGAPGSGMGVPSGARGADGKAPAATEAPRPVATATRTPTSVRTPTRTPTPSPTPTPQPAAAGTYRSNLVLLMRATNARQKAIGVAQTDWSLSCTADGGLNCPALTALDGVKAADLPRYVRAVQDAVGLTLPGDRFWNAQTRAPFRAGEIFSSTFPGRDWWPSAPEQGNLDEIRQVLARLDTVVITAMFPPAALGKFTPDSITPQTGFQAHWAAIQASTPRNTDLVAPGRYLENFKRFWHITRAFLSFDTNTLAGCTVESASLQLMHTAILAQDRPADDPRKPILRTRPPFVVELWSGAWDPVTKKGAGWGLGGAEWLDPAEATRDWEACATREGQISVAHTGFDSLGHDLFSVNSASVNTKGWTQFRLKLADESYPGDPGQPNLRQEAYALSGNHLDHRLIVRVRFGTLPAMPTSFR
ncbi:MAG: PKD domain-containing protein [Chloroflexi bacterium]|nr:PKD domain-containing protein [Chloroflexota bacterium]